jgi:hypothetical protein
MFNQELVLDELRSILLLHRHKHPNDVAEQVAAGLRNTVQKERVLELVLGELAILIVQRVWLEVDLDVSHQCAA